MKEFNNKSVWITGGSSGMGLALAKACAARGSHVHIIARRDSVLQQAVEEIKACSINPGQKIGSLRADVTRMEELQPLLLNLIEREGAPDLLVNAAGACHPAVFEDIGEEIFRKQMDLNFFGTLHTIQCVLPAMLKRGSGHIVNFSSAAGLIGLYGFTAYSASKFAVTGFTEALRSELRLKGIQVSIVFPPDTETPGLEEENKIKPWITKEISSAGSLEKPEDVARAVLRGIERNHFMILPGTTINLLYTVSRLLGRNLHRVVDFALLDPAVKKEARLKRLKQD